MGSHFLFQGIFPPQGSNWCILHWQVDSLSLCHLGSHSGKYSTVKSGWSFFSCVIEVSNIPGMALGLVVLLNFASMSLFTKAKLQSEHIKQLQCLSQQAVFRKVFFAVRCRLGYQGCLTQPQTSFPNLILPCLFPLNYHCTVSAVSVKK